MIKLLGKTEDGQAIVLIPPELAAKVVDLLHVVIELCPLKSTGTTTGGITPAGILEEKPQAVVEDAKKTVPRGVYGRVRPKPKKVKVQAAPGNTDRKPKYQVIRDILATAKAPMTVHEITAELNARGIAGTPANTGVSLCEHSESVMQVGKRGNLTLWAAKHKASPFTSYPKHGVKPAAAPAPADIGGGDRLAMIKARAERMNNVDPVERVNELANRQQSEDVG